MNRPFVLTMALVIGLATTAHAQLEQFDVDWDRISKGEVMVSSVTNHEGTPGVRAMFLISAPREKIWGALVDYAHFNEIFEGIRSVKVLEEDESGARVEFIVDAVLMNLTYVLNRQYIEPGRMLTWNRLSGDLKRIEGNWYIIDTHVPELKLVVYESYVELGGIGNLVPNSIVRSRTTRQSRSMCIRLRSWVESKK